jgi:hypothetical protein
VTISEQIPFDNAKLFDGGKFKVKELCKTPPFNLKCKTSRDTICTRTSKGDVQKLRAQTTPSVRDIAVWQQSRVHGLLAAGYFSTVCGRGFGH